MTKFKPGDRVLVDPDVTYDANNEFGGLRTIKSVNPDDTYPYIITGNEGEDGAFRETEVQYAPSQEFTLRQGDKVKNVVTGRLGIVEPAPISKCLKVYDLHPPYRDGVPATALEEYEEHHPGTYEITSRKEPF
jgi:hypothetical protein